MRIIHNSNRKKKGEGMKRFHFGIILTKYRWGWHFRLTFNRMCLEYEEGVWEFHKGYGKRGRHYRWGKRHPYKPIEL